MTDTAADRLRAIIVSGGEIALIARLAVDVLSEYDTLAGENRQLQHRILNPCDGESCESGGAAHCHRCAEAEADKLLTERDRLRAAIERVRSIHNFAECGNVRCKLGGWCIGCDPNGDSGCDEHPWPCPTVLALDPDAKLPDQYAAWVLKRDHDAVVAERDRLRAENRLLDALRDHLPGQCGRVRPHAPHRWLPSRSALDCPGIPKPGENPIRRLAELEPDAVWSGPHTQWTYGSRDPAGGTVIWMPMAESEARQQVARLRETARN